MNLTKKSANYKSFFTEYWKIYSMSQKKSQQMLQAHQYLKTASSRQGYVKKCYFCLILGEKFGLF